MSTSSTARDNPVNEIAALLSGEPVQADKQRVETPETLSADEADVNKETIEQPDENQETVESLEAEGTVDENPEAVDDVSEEDELTLNQFAEDLDVDVADMYALSIKMSEGDDMTLGTLKDFYESNKNIEELKATIKTKEEQLQADADLVRETPQITNELLQARAQVLSIQDQYNRTDWETLRTNDPGTYAALQQDFRMQFDLAKQNEEVANQTVSTHLDQSRQMQQDRLFEAMPQLRDKTNRTEALNAVTELTAKYGFTPDEVNLVEDNRLMRLLIDASKFANAEETVRNKLEVDTPRSARPAASRPVPSSKKASLKRLTERAQQTGQRRDQVNAVSALLDS